MNFFDFFGSAICHQIAERRFHAGGYALPLCARCTGIYLAIFASALLLFCLNRTHGNKPFSVFRSVLLCAGFFPLVIDVVSFTLGLRDTTNYIRFTTGALFAFGLPYLFILVRNFRADGEYERPIMKTPAELAVALLFCGVSLLLIRYGGFFGYLLISAFSLFGVVLLYYAVCNLALSRLLKKNAGFYSFLLAIGIICVIGYFRTGVQ